MAELRADGDRVVVSRTSDTTVVRLGSADESGGLLTLQGSHDDVVARDQCANLAHASLLVGIYMNAAATPQGAGSVTVYDDDRSFGAANLRLAKALQQDTLAVMNARGWAIPDDGVEPDSGFGSYVGDPSAGGLAAEAAAYNHLLLLGPSSPGFLTTPSDMPGAVIEPLYLTDPFEGSIADNRSDQHTVARGIAEGIERYLTPSRVTG
jgi:N-acetylmuramoyl-L-alanine amidase